MTATLDQRLRLNGAVRLRFDALSNTNVLLSPERGLRLNASASEVLARCTGQLTVREIVHEVFTVAVIQAAPDTVSIEQVTADVLELIDELRVRQLLVVDHYS